MKECISCCLEGEVDLPPIQNPLYVLQELLDGTSLQNRYFRDNIQVYNMALAFISCSYKLDNCIDFSRGIRYFQIHGALYHYQGSLVPEPGEIPRFVQLFFYDPDFARYARLQQFPALDPYILSELTDITIWK